MVAVVVVMVVIRRNGAGALAAAAAAELPVENGVYDGGWWMMVPRADVVVGAI